jgi:diguanylate cyclase (GGDEF)-like protein
MSEGKIFVVDDTPDNVELLTRILNRAGFDVSSADGGQLALEMIEHDPPELVLLDIQMPGMDGYEVCRRLKENPALSAIPVIFVSALDDVSDKVKGLEMGAVDYVTKPYQRAEVLARVRIQLKIYRLQRELEQRNAVIEQQKSELEVANAELMRLSTTDHLTGIPNRRRFIELVEEEIRVADRYGATFTLVMLDVDRFKAVHDTYGHDVGDQVLRHVATTIRSSLRASDAVARWGGEEFMVLLRRTDEETGYDVTEKLRKRLAESPVDPVGTVTASFGATQYRTPETFATVSNRVDELLYTAKREGRNRVATA